MKIKELRKNFIDPLSSYYGEDEALSFFYILTEKYLNMKRVQIALALDVTVSKEQLQLFSEARKRLASQEPIQYILGETEFYGSTIFVDHHVLIPRQETEELVDWVIDGVHQTKNERELKILDIGTGSGCIAISLAKNIKKAKVYALDVSKEALEVAEKNAKQNGVNIHCIQSDILKTEDLGEMFDVIISNPPYVRELEKKEMMPNVLEHEPQLALFVSDKDPLIFYQKIATLAKQSLSSEGSLYFEINQYLASEMVEMIQEIGFKTITLKKDLNENDRMIKATL